MTDRDTIERVRRAYDRLTGGAEFLRAVALVHEAYKLRVWGRSHAFAGYAVLQCPLDLWTYQELIASDPPPSIVQTGVYWGGSLAWFAALFDLLRLPDSARVVGIEVDPHPNARAIAGHPRVTLLEGDSTDPAVVAAARGLCPGGAWVSLDSDHSRGHVLRELDLYCGLVPPGGWLVVEDTNQPGPAEAAAAWLPAHADFAEQSWVAEATLFSFHTWLRKCA